MSNQPPVCECGRAATHGGVCRKSKQFYDHTPETDALIRDAYAKLRNFGNR